jgi:hypothetical protein
MWNDKPDGYGYEFLPVGMGMGTNFYPQPLCWQAGNFSTRSEPDPLPSLLPGRVPLLIALGKDDGVVQCRRLLQRDFGAERVTEAGDIQLDLLRFYEQWVGHGRRGT